MNHYVFLFSNRTSMLERLSYEQIQTLFTETYIKDLGETKFIKIAEKVLTSNKISGLISRSTYQNTQVTSKDILYTINSILYFTFTSNRNQALAGLLTLQRWNNEVNSDYILATGERLKLTAIEIIKDLKASFASIGSIEFQEPVMPKKLDIGKGVYLFPKRISYADFLVKLGDDNFKKSEIPSSKLITQYHVFDWNKLTNSAVGNWNFDNSPELISYFDKKDDLLTQQNLKFNSFHSAKMVFELISTQTDWTIEAVSPNKHTATSSSKDGKYKLQLEKESGNFGDENSGWLMLTYLK
jgi:hypothetical protein